MNVIEAVGVGVVAVLFVGIVLGLLIAWPVMLIAGALSSQLGWSIAYGYWSWYLIVLGLRLIIPTGTSASK